MGEDGPQWTIEGLMMKTMIKNIVTGFWLNMRTNSCRVESNKLFKVFIHYTKEIISKCAGFCNIM